MTLSVAIETRDSALLGEIFNEPETADARPIELAPGVSLTGIEWRFHRGAGAADIAMTLLGAAAGIPASVVASLLTDWLRSRRSRIETVSINELELDLDDDGAVRNIVARSYDEAR